LETEVVEKQVPEAEVVVTKIGQTTIPVKLRRKYKIEEGTKLAVIDTKESILVATMKEDFQVISVDDKIAQASAELRHKNNLSIGDSMIAATALMLKAVCNTNDPHFRQIKEIETT
jgi:bifunctional DNA-binding transcriptional regulator/antitoxin component of YhaV-PrlF toxin-antitoxin module